MKKLKVYEYPKCSTCKKALKFLLAQNIPFEVIDITTNPPSSAELSRMLGHLGEIKKLFNTSGLVYKEMRLSEKVAHMGEKEAIHLLSKNGRLIKRPFVLGDGWGLIGFKEDEWRKHLS